MSTMTAGTTDLAEFLMSIGVEVTKIGQEISARCPVHISRVGKEDRSPSWSMNASTGAWLCYSCGAKGSLRSLVKEITGKDDMEIVTMIMNHNIEQLSMPQWETEPEPDHQRYLRFMEVPEKHLQSRNITSETARLYGVKWDYNRNSWIIPIISSEGHLMGWQEKGAGITYNYPTGVRKGKTLFGIERAKHKTSILVESPLDVVRFASSFDGMNCLATFGAHVTKIQMQLACLVSDKIIIAMDNDGTGIASAKKIFDQMPLLKGGVYWLKYSHTDAKDIGEMDDAELEEAIVGASVIPWWL